MSWLFALGWFAFGVVCVALFAALLWLVHDDEFYQDDELPQSQPTARVGSYRPTAWCVACHAPYRIEAKQCPECGAEVKA